LLSATLGHAVQVARSRPQAFLLIWLSPTVLPETYSIAVTSVTGVAISAKRHHGNTASSPVLKCKAWRLAN